MQSEVRVIDHHDREIYTRDNQQLVSLNQHGQVDGHYMQVDGRRDVLTNAISSNQRTLFKTHTGIEFDASGGHHQIVILENQVDGCVVGINKEDDTVTAKELSRSLSKYNTLEEVREEHPEVLFYKVSKEPGSVEFYFKSCLKDKQRILGFNNNGEALNPTQVQPNQEESLFKMI